MNLPTGPAAASRRRHVAEADAPLTRRCWCCCGARNNATACLLKLTWPKALQAQCPAAHGIMGVYHTETHQRCPRRQVYALHCVEMSWVLPLRTMCYICFHQQYCHCPCELPSENWAKIPSVVRHGLDPTPVEAFSKRVRTRTCCIFGSAEEAFRRVYPEEADASVRHTSNTTTHTNAWNGSFASTVE